MSTKINNSTLVYNGGSLKFEDTGSKFRNYVLPTGIQIKTLLDLDTISGVSSLDYKKPLDEYNLHNFFFFYNTYTEDGTLNIANLDKGDDAKTFLIYVSIAQSVDVRITSMTNYRGDVPVLEPNTDYLILVTKESNGLVVEIIAKSVILNSCLKLVFNIKKENLTLDLSDTFPDVIYGFTPRYRGAVYFDVDESGEVVGDGYKLENKDLLTHTYDTPGLHTVTVKGICEGLGQVPSSCVRCEEASGIKYFGKLFCYCVNFTSFPDTIFQDIGGQSELNGCFQGTQITRIPENLFPRNRTIKRIVGLFSENVKLTDYGQEKSVIPENLFTPLENLEELVSVFDSCYYITKVPGNIFKNNKKLINTFRCFNGTGIDNDPVVIGDEIPEGIIDGLNVTNTEATFGMLGYGRMMRHVDNYENPHNVTLQQAYDKQLVINGNSVDIGEGLSFTGSPLNVVDAQTDDQAVTLKQLKDAQVNHVVVKGEWNVTGKTDYSSIPYKEVGYCYLIKGTTTTIEGQTWNEGDFLLIAEGDTAGSLKYLKFENTNSWQEMVQLNYGNTANLTANTVRKEVYVGNDAVFRVSSFTSDQTLFKHPSGNGIVFTSTGNSISGSKPLTLASDPVNSMDAVTKQYMDENSGWAIKTWNNTSTDPDADKKETAWTGQNVFTGGGRIGMFYFNPDSTNQELKSYVESNFTVSHNRHVASLGKGNIDNYSGAYLELVYQKQGTYGLSDVNSIIQIVNNDGSGYRNQFVETSGNKFFEELRLSSSEKIKEFSGNITVLTDKTVFNNDNEFITKKYVDENSGTAIKSWNNIDTTSSSTSKTSAWVGENKFTNTTEFSADVSITDAAVITNKVGADNFSDNEFITKNVLIDLNNGLETKLREHIASEVHVSELSSDSPELMSIGDLDSSASKNIKAFYFFPRTMQNTNTGDDAPEGWRYSNWVLHSISVKPVTDGSLNDTKIWIFKGVGSRWENISSSSNSTVDSDGFVEFSFSTQLENGEETQGITVDKATKLAFLFTSSGGDEPKYGDTGGWTSGTYYPKALKVYSKGTGTSDLDSSISEEGGSDSYDFCVVTKISATPLLGLSALGIEIPTVDDLESNSIVVVRNLFPVGYVFTTTYDYSNSEELRRTWPNTNWVKIGSQTIGSKTVHYWERTL